MVQHECVTAEQNWYRDRNNRTNRPALGFVMRQSTAIKAGITGTRAGHRTMVHPML